MSRIIKNWQHQSIALAHQFVINDGQNKLNCHLDIAANIVFFIALHTHTSISIRVGNDLEEGVVGRHQSISNTGNPFTIFIVSKLTVITRWNISSG